MILLIELSGITIAIFAILLLARPKPNPGNFLARILLIALTSWVMEDSAIGLYRFYSYNPAWHFWLDRVPLLVVITWPIIICSALDLTSPISADRQNAVPFIAAFIVLTDALFIEPIAVNAGLWSWSHPGIFNVPLIGLLGWTYYAFLWTFVLNRSPEQNKIKRIDLLSIVFVVAGTHLLLLLSWWAVLRWVHFQVNMLLTSISAWILSFLSVVIFVRRNSDLRVEKRTLLLRMPAALFFFILLFLNLTRSKLLLIYATAFVPPYLTLMVQAHCAGYRKD